MMKNDITSVKRILISIPAVLLSLLLVFSAFAPEQTRADEATEIRTYEELLKIAENPGGSYRLMADIDMKDKAWIPVDFSGSFDGGGHAILNLSITSCGAAVHSTYDGNMVEYATNFSGLFGSLVNAYVGNLKVLGFEISLNTDTPTFVGGIAGYMENSTISGCRLYGFETLYTSGQSFGVGGIAGFGNGVIENTYSDMTLVCVDTDRENKDEQFMGGAYAAGCIDLSGNTIRINGCDSDHGYVHNGGLAGMYIMYTGDEEHAGFITGNTVDGQITFFEDNEDRRAYCEAYIGEIMNWTFAPDDAFNPDNFVRNEVYDYDTDLLPHYDDHPQYETTAVEATETENGYTIYTCANDGYQFYWNFTPVVGNYVPETAEEETTEYPYESATVPLPESLTKGKPSGFLIAMIILAVLVIIVLIVLIMQKNNMKQRRLRNQRIAEKRRVQRSENPYLEEERRPESRPGRTAPRAPRGKKRKTPPGKRRR